MSRFICVKAPKLPEGEALPVPVPVPVPVPEPVRVPVPVVEPAHMGEPDPDHKEDEKVGEDLWNIVYSIFQTVAMILSIMGSICAMYKDLKDLSGAEAKKLEEASRKNEQLLNYMLLMLHLQLELDEQIMEKLAADEKAKKESWFCKFIGYK